MPNINLKEFKESWLNVLKNTNNSPIIISEDNESKFINVGVNTFNSFEQLWLAFTMKEKYNKEWSEEKQTWILIE